MFPRAILLLAATMSLAQAAVPIPDPQFSKDYAETQRYQLGRPTALRFTPDGRQLFFLRSGARDATRRLYAFDTATATTRELITPQQVLGTTDEVLSKETRWHLYSVAASSQTLLRRQWPTCAHAKTQTAVYLALDSGTRTTASTYADLETSTYSSNA